MIACAWIRSLCSPLCAVIDPLNSAFEQSVGHRQPESSDTERSVSAKPSGPTALVSPRRFHRSIDSRRRLRTAKQDQRNGGQPRFEMRKRRAWFFLIVLCKDKRCTRRKPNARARAAGHLASETAAMRGPRKAAKRGPGKAGTVKERTASVAAIFACRRSAHTSTCIGLILDISLLV